MAALHDAYHECIEILPEADCLRVFFDHDYFWNWLNFYHCCIFSLVISNKTISFKQKFSQRPAVRVYEIHGNTETAQPKLKKNHLEDFKPSKLILLIGEEIIFNFSLLFPGVAVSSHSSHTGPRDFSFNRSTVRLGPFFSKIALVCRDQPFGPSI